MANDMQSISGMSPPPPERGGPRRLWQVPVFLAGVLAVLAVVLVRPPGAQPAHSTIDAELHAAREALRQTPSDDRAALRFARKVLDHADAPPAAAAEAHYVVGLILSRQAQAADAKAAPALWQAARERLEQAEKLGVPDADREELAYALARATWQTGAKPERIVELLAHAMPGAVDERADALDMLTQSYLKLPTPDVEAALAANEKLLGLPIDGGKRLPAARLRRAELLMRLDHREDARVTLATITPQAPPDIYARARRLRAELCARDNLWADARRLWQEILQDNPGDPAERARSLFNLGLCCARTGAAAEALAAWQEAARSEDETGQGASLLLAGLAVRQNDLPLACTSLQRAFRGIAEPGAYHNSLVPLDEARHICEDACQALRDHGDLERRRELALTYASVAPPGRAQELLADTLETMAEECQQKAGATADKPEAQQLDKAAQSDFAQAGAACAAAADLLKGRPAEIELRWRAAQDLIHAEDLPRAIAALIQFLTLHLPDERSAEAWYMLGTVYQASGNETEATRAYHHCIETRNSAPYAYRARYQLAEAAIRDKHLDDAEAILRQNLELMGIEPDAEAHEKTLLKLAGLLYRRGDYRIAAVHLQQALDRYPGNARSTMARHVLADCYRRLAEQEKPTYKAVGRSVRDADASPRDQYRVWLNLAATNYQKLREGLLAAKTKAPLADAEAAILREVDFAELECRFNLGQYEMVVQLCEGLVDRYRDSAQSMIAFRKMLSCYWTIGQTESDKERKTMLARKARAAIDSARLRLSQLKDDAFGNDEVTHNRAWWQQWLDWASRQPWDDPTKPAH